MSRLTPIVDRFAPAMLGSWGRFLTSGAFNTLVTYALYLVLLRRLSYQASFTIAYASGIALAYAMNRYLVFRQPGGRAGPLLVVAIYVGQYFVNLAIVSAAVRWFLVPAWLAPLFAIALTVPLTYLLNQRVFSGGEARAETEAMLLSARLRQWWRPAATALLVGLPILSLALNAIAWLRFGFDLPFYDDWRAYDSFDVDSLEPTYLWQPLNDTLTPIGLALDALAQRLLDGNSIVYQLLSMLLVLGALLLLQWKLLKIALKDPLRTAACFVFTLLMLQPGSYWGRENLAYQQALPLVFILTALWLAAARPWREQWSLAAIFLLGLLSGFTYISGAFGAFAAGAGVVCVALLVPEHPDRIRTLRAGGALALAGAATSALQFVLAILPYKGGTHAEGMPLALPSEADFWLTYFGKVARSLLLPADEPILSLVIVVLALAAFIAVSVVIFRQARSVEEDTPRFLAFSATFAAVGAMVITYLMLVAAGRTNFRPVGVVEALDVFAYGFQRFHFFWAALLWPWLAAGLLVAGDRWKHARPARKLPAGAGALAVIAAVVAMAWGGALDHIEFQRHELSQRQPTIECLLDQLQKEQGIRCPEWNMQDLSSAYIYARHIGASFVRHFPIFPVALGTDAPLPWFRLSRDGARVTTQQVVLDSPSLYRGGKDARLYVDVADADDMAHCAMLDVRGSIRADGRDFLTVYYRPKGQHDYTQASSSGEVVGMGPEPAMFSIRLESAAGFEKTLRIEPVASGRPFELRELEVRCRLLRPHSAGGSFFSISRTKGPVKLQRLEPIGDGPGRFLAGERPTIEFRTGQRHNMASCRELAVDANFRADTSDMIQVFFRPRGVGAFSEQHSVTMPIVPSSKPRPMELVIHSATGFEDELRVDPVRHAQPLQFVDVGVRCLERILRPHDKS